MGEQRVMISDFGLSTKDNPAKECWGTPAFLAPEQHSKLYNPFISDVWQMGCTLYKIMFGQLPYRYGKKKDKLMQEIKNQQSENASGLNFPKTKMCSKSCKELILQMLSDSYRNRIDMKGISRHAWLASNEVKKQENHIT